MKKILITASLVIFCALSLGALEPRVLKISMPGAITDSLKNSAKLKSAEMEAAAAKSAAKSQRSFLYPRFFFDGTYRYVTSVPSLDIPIPAIGTRKLGDNNNYSVGPALTWTLWDKNGARKNWAGAEEQEKSKEAAAEAVKKQLIFAARAAYFQSQMALEQLRLISGYLALAQAQYRDIKLSCDAGSKSKIDEMMANREVLAKKKMLIQARTELAEALRDLAAITGEDGSYDLSLPFYSADEKTLPEGIEPPTVILEMDSIGDSFSALEKYAAAVPDDSHPAIRAISDSARALDSAAEGLKAAMWPKIILSAKSSVDYPNGPDPVSFNQNAVGVAASFPLFEAGRTKKMSEEQSRRAEALRMQARQSEQDLERDWAKASDRLKGLLLQKEINKQYAGQAEELAKIVYKSFMAGRSTCLEVQSADNRALEAKTESVRTDIGILIQLATLENMSK